MVKRQKEKQYQSSAEHRQNSQLRSGNRTGFSTRPVPFDCCALTLTPFSNPVMRLCGSNGIIFENSAIIPYILKHKADPVTGKAMKTSDLITLQMDKSEEGKWQCPVLNKPFLNHTKIVAVLQKDKSAANVYSYEAVHELNIKAKSYLDLITGDKFQKTDIITLQDSANMELNQLRDVNNFKHTSSLRKQHLLEEQENSDVKLSVSATRIVDKIKRKREDEQKAKQKDVKKDGKKLKIFTDELTGVSMTSGQASGSFTSTALNINNDNTAREATEEEILEANFAAMKKLKRKGFVRLNTNLGLIDLEIHCDIVPRTSMNFIRLVEKGAYNDTKFHRSIRNFMIQGGKPSNKSETEESFWEGTFKDEFDDRLKHVGPGILSMANAGQHTNKRQFFITYKSAPHLDRKHSVFGKVIKGSDVLSEMESIQTDKKDRPQQEIKIITAEVLYSPIDEAIENERLRIQKRAYAMKAEKEERKNSALGTKIVKVPIVEKIEADTGPVVGKYIKQNKVKKQILDDQSYDAVPMSRLPKPPKKTTFGDFSGW